MHLTVNYERNSKLTLRCRPSVLFCFVLFFCFCLFVLFFFLVFDRNSLKFKNHLAYLFLSSLDNLL